jgi:hypothetical protein
VFVVDRRHVSPHRALGAAQRFADTYRPTARWELRAVQKLGMVRKIKVKMGVICMNQPSLSK